MPCFVLFLGIKRGKNGEMQSYKYNTSEMKEFGCKLRIIPLQDISAVTARNITYIREDRILTIYTQNDVIVTPSSQRSDAGCLYSYQITTITNSNSSLKKYLPLEVVIELYDNNGNSFYLGTKDFPAKITAKDYLNKISLSIEVSTPLPFLI